MIGIKYKGHDESYDCARILELFYDDHEIVILEDENNEKKSETEEPVSFEAVLENTRFEFDSKIINETKVYDTEGQLTFLVKDH